MRCLVSIIHHSPTTDADVDYRISKAQVAFSALSNVLRNKGVSNHHKKKEKFIIKLLSCLLRFMGVKFGAYEKNNSIDSEASMSAVSVACTVSAFIMHKGRQMGIPGALLPCGFPNHDACWIHEYQFPHASHASQTNSLSLELCWLCPRVLCQFTNQFTPTPRQPVKSSK